MKYGLRQRILRAKTEEEIARLQLEGTALRYQYASAVTRRGWKLAADRRRMELKHEKLKGAPAVQARKIAGS